MAIKKTCASPFMTLVSTWHAYAFPFSLTLSVFFFFFHTRFFVPSLPSNGSTRTGGIGELRWFRPWAEERATRRFNEQRGTEECQ